MIRSLFMLLLLGVMGNASAREVLVYVGTNTRPGGSEGLYVARFNVETGHLTEPAPAARIANPTFLALSPDRRHLYTVSEIAGESSGAVVAFAIDAQTGGLTALGQASSEGRSPCHLVVDPEGRHILAANYQGGSVAVLPIQANGGIGKATSIVRHTGSSAHPTRQTQPYAHSINVSPDGRFAYVADLGTDRIMVYHYDARRGLLAPATPPSADLPPGAGPRHFALHPSLPRAYTINELDNTITTFARDETTGTLAPLQTVPTLPPGFEGANTTAEIIVHPSGLFVYGSNRGHDSLVVHAVNPADSLLSYVEHVPTGGRTPRHFTLDPTGRWLIAANQGSDTLVIFAVDPATGRLTPTGRSVSVPMPVCIRFLD